MISSSPTALITMHNVKRFLEESMYANSFPPHFLSTLTHSLTSSPPPPHPPPFSHIHLSLTLPDTSSSHLIPSSFEPSTAARARATSEGNPRPEDLIPIYRKRTTIDTSGRETTTSQTYYVIDSAEVLGKFGADAWDRVVCVMTTGQAWQFRPYKWKEPLSLFHHGEFRLTVWRGERVWEMLGERADG